MEIKNFNEKKIKIRMLSRRDLRNAKKFQDFINSLIEENAKISMNKKISLKEERKWLQEQLKKIKNRKRVFLVAEQKNMIVGTTGIDLGRGRHEYVGIFGITIRKGYRGIGLGSYLMGKIIKLAKKELKPLPKVIRLSVYPNNKPARGLYKKFGFKEVARIPKQINYKRKLFAEVVMLKYL